MKEFILYIIKAVVFVYVIQSFLCNKFPDIISFFGIENQTNLIVSKRKNVIITTVIQK